MQSRPFVVASLLLGLISCSQGSPSAPVQSTPASTSGVVQLPGVVRDDRGQPIAGAMISFWPPTGTVLTNEAGRFPLPGGYVEMAVASKDGYEYDQKFIDFDFVELTLHDIITVSVGQSARLTIGPNDAPGGMPADRYRTRIVHLASSEAVTAQIQVTADDNSPAEYWIDRRCVGSCPIESGFSTYRIEAGAELQMRIRTPNVLWNRTFTVSVAR